MVPMNPSEELIITLWYGVVGIGLWIAVGVLVYRKLRNKRIEDIGVTKRSSRLDLS